jgi:hypothetical protein
MRIAINTVVVVTLCGLLGCGGGAPSPPAPPASDATGAAPPPPAPASTAANADRGGPQAARAAPPQSAAGEDHSEEAAAGVGAKGRDYGGPGIISTPIETFFRVEERITFEAQIPNNLKIYKAQHNNKGPKNQEEFMQAIIKDGGVSLPELPPGDVYWYDPKTERLMVRHPTP